MDEITPLDPEDLVALFDTQVTIKGIDHGGIAFEREDGTTILVYACHVCGGPDAHVNVVALPDGVDISAS